MNPRLFIPLILVSLLVGGCTTRNGSYSSKQRAPETILAEPTQSSYWFVGCWRSAVGGHLYVSDVNPEGKAKLFFKSAGDEYGYYDDCYVEGADKDKVYLGTSDEEGYEKDVFFAYKSLNQIIDERTNIAYNRDPSIAGIITEEIKVSLTASQNTQNDLKSANKEAQKELLCLINNNYPWIYGQWKGQDGIMIIKKPNLVKIPWVNSKGWYQFWLEDPFMYVDFGQDGDKFYLNSSDMSIAEVSYDDNSIIQHFTKKGNKGFSSQNNNILSKNKAKKTSGSVWRSVFDSNDRAIFDTRLESNVTPTIRVQYYLVLHAFSYSEDKTEGTAIIVDKGSIDKSLKSGFVPYVSACYYYKNGVLSLTQVTERRSGSYDIVNNHLADELRFTFNSSEKYLSGSVLIHQRSKPISVDRMPLITGF